MDKKKRDGIADRLAAFSGSWLFFAMNALWFLIWIALNVWTSYRFDVYPFSLLTMVVSLEAILLTILVLIAQQRQDQADRRIAHLDYRTNQEAEQGVQALIEHMRQQDKRLERIEAMLKGGIRDA